MGWPWRAARAGDIRDGTRVATGGGEPVRRWAIDGRPALDAGIDRGSPAGSCGPAIADPGGDPTFDAAADPSGAAGARSWTVAATARGALIGEGSER